MKSDLAAIGALDPLPFEESQRWLDSPRADDARRRAIDLGTSSLIAPPRPNASRVRWPIAVATGALVLLLAAPVLLLTDETGVTTTMLSPGNTIMPEPGATPSACAAAMAEHLVKIEPIVADFDPTMAFSEFYEIVDAADEVLDPDLTAPYGCEDEGLNWAFFSWQSAWDEILSIAREHAPGTIPFMEAFRRLTSLDEPALAGVAMPSCEELVGDLERAMDGQASAGNEELLNAPFHQAIEILTLSFYITYLENDGSTCMPDVLRAEVESFSPTGAEPHTTTRAP